MSDHQKGIQAKIHETHSEKFPSMVEVSAWVTEQERLEGQLLLQHGFTAPPATQEEIPAATEEAMRSVEQRQEALELKIEEMQKDMREMARAMDRRITGMQEELALTLGGPSGTQEDPAPAVGPSRGTRAKQGAKAKGKPSFKKKR